MSERPTEKTFTKFHRVMRLLDYLENYPDNDGNTTTVIYLMGQCDYSSMGLLWSDLQELYIKGLISKKTDRNESIHNITKLGVCYLSEQKEKWIAFQQQIFNAISLLENNKSKFGNIKQYASTESLTCPTIDNLIFLLLLSKAPSSSKKLKLKAKELCQSPIHQINVNKLLNQLSKLDDPYIKFTKDSLWEITSSGKKKLESVYDEWERVYKGINKYFKIEELT